MGVLCDGMGGLAKGELASAAVVRAFEEWFDQELPGKIAGYTWGKLALDWRLLIKEANDRLQGYGKRNQVTLGTTVSAILIIEERYMIAHVGDTRIYKIKDSAEQLTRDQTLAARAAGKGAVTGSRAMGNFPVKGFGRNVLTQCVGASKTVIPDMLFGRVEKNSVYMICSDGFWHELKAEEIYGRLRWERSRNLKEMAQNSRFLVEEAKARNERDNISIALIRCGG